MPESNRYSAFPKAFSPDRHTETVTLNFSEVQVEYTPLDGKGAGATESFKWDIARNTGS